MDQISLEDSAIVNKVDEQTEELLQTYQKQNTAKMLEEIVRVIPLGLLLNMISLDNNSLELLVKGAIAMIYIGPSGKVLADAVIRKPRTIKSVDNNHFHQQQDTRIDDQLSARYKYSKESNRLNIYMISLLIAFLAVFSMDYLSVDSAPLPEIYSIPSRPEQLPVVIDLSTPIDISDLNRLDSNFQNLDRQVMNMYPDEGFDTSGYYYREIIYGVRREGYLREPQSLALTNLEGSAGRAGATGVIKTELEKDEELGWIHTPLVRDGTEIVSMSVSGRNMITNQMEELPYDLYRTEEGTYVMIIEPDFNLAIYSKDVVLIYRMEESDDINLRALRPPQTDSFDIDIASPEFIEVWERIVEEGVTLEEIIQSTQNLQYSLEDVLSLNGGIEQYVSQVFQQGKAFCLTSNTTALIMAGLANSQQEDDSNGDPIIVNLVLGALNSRGNTIIAGEIHAFLIDEFGEIQDGTASNGISDDALTQSLINALQTDSDLKLDFEELIEYYVQQINEDPSLIIDILKNTPEVTESDEIYIVENLDSSSISLSLALIAIGGLFTSAFLYKFGSKILALGKNLFYRNLDVSRVEQNIIKNSAQIEDYLYEVLFKPYQDPNKKYEYNPLISIDIKKLFYIISRLNPESIKKGTNTRRVIRQALKNKNFINKYRNIDYEI